MSREIDELSRNYTPPPLNVFINAIKNNHVWLNITESTEDLYILYISEINDSIDMYKSVLERANNILQSEEIDKEGFRKKHVFTNGSQIDCFEPRSLSVVTIEKNIKPEDSIKYYKALIKETINSVNVIHSHMNTSNCTMIRLVLFNFIAKLIKNEDKRIHIPLDYKELCAKKHLLNGEDDFYMINCDILVLEFRANKWNCWFEASDHMKINKLGIESNIPELMEKLKKSTKIQQESILKNSLELTPE